MSSTTENSASVHTDQKQASNTEWAISLFGTAVGAGILFLPINAGSFGFWPLLVATLLIGPMTYFSHRGLARMICVSPRQGEDGPDPRKVDTSGVSYAAWVSVADMSASKSSGARRLHQECRLRVL